MTTTPLGATPAASTAAPPPSAGTSLTTNDFVKMMITQLRNQDPLQPTSSDQLMSQMSQIGQLQSTTQLQTTLTGLAQQTQIGAASSLIGKQVVGLDANNKPLTGIVTSVQVSTSGVGLNLDNGNTLDLAKVTTISPPAGAAAAVQK